VDQMDLAQIRLPRIARDAREVLDRDAGMGITLDPHSGEQADARVVRLVRAVRLATAYGNDNGAVIHPRRRAGS